MASQLDNRAAQRGNTDMFGAILLPGAILTSGVLLAGMYPAGMRAGSDSAGTVNGE